jgi:RNA polymerase sigma-70 factor (ECF subfamily)
MRTWEPNDAELLKSTRSDGRAFAQFYDRYEAPVASYFSRRVHNREVAADLTAEVFAAVLLAAPRYRPDGPTAAPWLFTIAHNVLAKSVKRGRVEARARRRIGIREAVTFDPEELERVDALASGGTVEELLTRLPSDQADAIRLRIVEERDYAEIAAELQTSELVVRKRVSRGLATLRRKVEQEGGR